MTIVRAQIEDVREIIKLARFLRFDPGNPSHLSSLTVLEKEEYWWRILNSRYFYVARNNGGLDGYLMSYNNEFVDSLIRQVKFPHEEIISYLSCLPKPFSYGESMGVNQSVRDKGIGKSLVKRWLSDLKRDKIDSAHVMIRHAPYGNGVSIKLCQDLGFAYCGIEVEGHGMVHGIYRKSV